METLGKHRRVDSSERWPFLDEPEIAVFSLKRIFAGESQVKYVLHGHDGSWQFLDGDDCTEEDCAIVAISEIVAHDPTMRELAALPCGFFAVRETTDGPWHVGYRGDPEAAEGDEGEE